VKRTYLILLTLLFCSTAFSQTVIKRIYIKGGNAAYEELIKTIFLYPQFKPGIILYKNGQRYYKPVNYNCIESTIVYIENTDTLLLADESQVNTVIVDNDVFFFTPACLRIIYNGKVKLFKYEKMKTGDVQKIGAFGIPNTGSAIETVQQYDTYPQSYKIDVNETILISHAVTYLIDAGGDKYLPASKKNYLKVHSDKSNELQQFIKEKNINFNQEQDLLALVKYTEELIK
jgi:hypothetical protein